MIVLQYTGIHHVANSQPGILVTTAAVVCGVGPSTSTWGVSARSVSGAASVRGAEDCPAAGRNDTGRR